MVKKLNIWVLLVLFVFTTNTFAKQYDELAKTTYSKNDVSAFVYEWFAMFDHQVDIDELKKHLPKQKVTMNFPNFPIKEMADFERWYQGVIDNIQFNSHDISNLKVSGDEKNGFKVFLHVNWKANTYDKKVYDIVVAQEWEVKVDENREFIITNHKAWVL